MFRMLVGCIYPQRIVSETHAGRKPRGTSYCSWKTAIRTKMVLHGGSAGCGGGVE